jgi:flagellar biosynthesis protein
MPKKPPQNPTLDRMDDDTPIQGKNGIDSDLSPLNIKEKPKRATAVAITFDKETGDLPRISAAGRGKLAEQILQIAFDQGIKVREDQALAEMLAKVELDSPIPSEAFLSVAEVLSYVYRANGEPDPFNAILDDLTTASPLTEG